MITNMIPVAVESRLVVALLETEVLEKKREKKVPSSANGSVTLDTT